MKKVILTIFIVLAWIVEPAEVQAQSNMVNTYKQIRKLNYSDGLDQLDVYIKELEANKNYMSASVYRYRSVWLQFMVGELNFLKGDWRTAQKNLLQVTSTLNTLPAKDPFTQELVDVRVNSTDILAELYLIQGDTAQSSQLYQKSRAIRAQHKDKLSSMSLRNTYNEASYFFHLHQWDSAAAYFEDYLLQYKNNYFDSDDLTKYAQAYVHLSLCYYHVKRTDYISYALKGKALYEHPWLKQQGGNFNGKIDASFTLAFYYFNQALTDTTSESNRKENLLLAKKEIALAVNLFEQELKSSLVYMPELYVLANKIYLALQDIPTADQCIQQAASMYFNKINKTLPYQTEYQRFYFYTNNKYLAEDIKSYFSYRIQDPMVADSMSLRLVEFNLNTKGALLNSSMRFLEKIYDNTDPQIEQLYKQLITAKSILSYQVSKYGAKYKAVVQQNDTIQAIENRLLDLLKLKPESYTYYASILKSIPKDYDWIDIVRTKTIKKVNGLYVYSDSIHYVYYIYNHTQNKSYVSTNQTGYLETKYYKMYTNAIKFNLPSSRIYTYYIKDWMAFTGNTSLLVSGDGVYNLMNLATIQDTSGQFLQDHYQFYYVGNGKELLTQQKGIELEHFTFLARPDFSNHVQSLADLPGTEYEVNGIIANISDTISYQLYKGKAANEKNVLNATHSSVFHFATHGYFVATAQDPMFYSGLFLSITDTVSQDGILTAYEVSNLKLSSTGLVVLSACETGLGTVTEGEGIWGLQRGFQSAGVPYLIISLFKVDDEVSAVFMTELYKQLLLTGDVKKAFYSAENTIKIKYKEPKLWGAFVLRGF